MPHDGHAADRIFKIENGSQATRKTKKTMPRTFIARRSLVVSVPPLNTWTAFCTKVLRRNDRCCDEPTDALEKGGCVSSAAVAEAQ